MQNMDLNKYKKHVRKHLNQLTKITRRCSLGDYSHHISLPKQRNEFTDLFIDLSILIDNLKKRMDIKKSVITQLKTEVEKNIDQEVYEHMNDGVVITDDQGKICQFNKSFADMSGYGSDLIGKSLTEFVVKNDIKKVKDETGIILRTGLRNNFECTLLNKNIGEIPVLVKPALIKNKDGSPKGITIIIYDNSEYIGLKSSLEKTRKELVKIRNSADEASEFAENLFNTVREPLLALDQDLRVVKASRSFYDFFKVTPNATSGSLIYNLGNNQWDIPKLRELLETILPEKTSFNDYEVEHDFSIIGKRTMLLNARQVERVEGNKKIILLAIEDITRRKVIEAGLEKSRKELAMIKISADEISEFSENIFDTVREPLLALDQDLRVVKASRSFYEFFKVHPNETIRKLIYKLGNHQWDIPKLRELLEKILPEKTTFNNYEVEHDFSTIGKHIMLLNARQVERAERNEKIILLAIEDITERRIIEKSLYDTSCLAIERADQLENANKELESFSYSISHDLKSPLRAITGFANFLHDNYSNKIDDEGNRLVNVIIENSYKMGRLIDDLLLFSRFGRVDFERGIINMNKLFLKVWDEVKLLSSHVKINFNISKLPSITADISMIQQVLINLLSNAVKFSQYKNEIEIEVGSIKKKGQFIFYVKDNGAGFDMKYANKLFNVFQRLHVTKEYEGNGIGLAIVNKIISRHGGKVWAESEENKGATFYFSLPLNGDTQ